MFPTFFAIVNRVSTSKTDPNAKSMKCTKSAFEDLAVPSAIFELMETIAL